MSGFLYLLFYQLTGNLFDNKLPEKDGIETRKCMKCLRRYELDWIKCPYCEFTNFYANYEM